MKPINAFLIATLLLFATFFGQAQTSCTETVTLPTDTKLGGGDVQGSQLIGSTYTAGQGPGIYIVADGGYRLYLNGELLAYDNAAGRVRFIPMTFLPGANAISVVGINGQGAPGVLVHVDELEKPYTSSASWKANAAPADNTWKNKTYSDASWAAAAVQSSGSLTQTPSGVAFSGFPATSAARWIWTANASNASAVLRTVFTIKAVGFGEATTGGAGGTVTVVTTAAELVAACQSATTQIILVPEGTLDCRNYRAQSVCRQTCSDNLSSGGYNGDWITNGATCPGTTVSVTRHEQLIWMNSNKSIIGMGRGASLRGAAFYANAGNVRTNMIFRNLAIWDVNPHIIEAGDAISINSASKLWVDHCSFKWVTDGNDIDGTTQCTFSWNHWDGYNNFACSGRDHYTAMIRGSDITFDHDFWDGASGRVPKTYGTLDTRIHMINNYHYDNTYYASESGGPNLLVYVENTHYEKVRFPTVRLDGGVMYCSGNLYTTIETHMGANWKATTEPKDAAAKFAVPYTYTLDNVSEVKAMVSSRSGIGAQWGTMPTYTDAAGWTNKGPVVSVTVPASGASFSNPTSITITASATDAGGSVSKVEFFSGATLIGTATASPFSIDFTQFANCTYSIVAVATDNSGIKTMSQPVTFTVSAQPKTFIYQSPVSDLWTNTALWTPNGTPGNLDTAVIRSGEVKIAQDFAGYIKVETNGILRAAAFANLSTVALLGGAIKVNSTNQTYGMKANIVVKEPSSIISGFNPLTLFTLDGTIAGSANLTKKDLGVVKVTATATDFKGNWLVAQDTLTIASASGLGTCGAIVDTAVLDIDVAATTYSLTIHKMGKLNLDANLSVQAAVFDNINLAAGTYKAADYPAFISGTGSLIVAKSVLTTSASNNTITLASNAGATYSWSNGTADVASTASYSPTITGSYTVKATAATGCAITSAPVSALSIALAKGWNLFSINLIPDTAAVGSCRDACPCVSTLFAGLDVQEIKDMHSFWRKGQNDMLNGMKTITPGAGYLVLMNTEGTLSVTGTPIVETHGRATLPTNGWQLIGCPYPSASPIVGILGSTFSELKDFEGFNIPGNANNTILNIEPGKGYFVK